MESMLTNSTTRGCILGEQFHLAGSSWYPYLPPNGFDTCTVCTCDPITLDVKCPHVQCPPLPCSDKVAYRPDKKACCKKCPEVFQLQLTMHSSNFSNEISFTDQTRARREESRQRLCRRSRIKTRNNKVT